MLEVGGAQEMPLPLSPQPLLFGESHHHQKWVQYQVGIGMEEEEEEEEGEVVVVDGTAPFSSRLGKERGLW